MLSLRLELFPPVFDQRKEKKERSIDYFVPVGNDVFTLKEFILTAMRLHTPVMRTPK